MKKVWKIVLIAAIALIVLGAALFIVALLTGGSFSGLAARSGALDYLSGVLNGILGILPLN